MINEISSPFTSCSIVYFYFNFYPCVIVVLHMSMTFFSGYIQGKSGVRNHLVGLYSELA